MTVCLIDGDVVAYQSCENRNVKEIIDATGEFDALFMYEEHAEYTDEENEEYLNNAFKIFKKAIEHLCEINFATSVKVAVAGQGNFRKEVFPMYKVNRHAEGKVRNLFVPLIRQMAVDEGIAVAADGMEADDLLSMWAAECKAVDEDFVVCSIDKDLKVIEGRHYLMHPNKRCMFESTPEYARRFYHEQLLMGDPVDAIPGLPKIGPIKAKLLLEKCKELEEFQTTVRQAYYDAFQENWKEELMITGQLIYLKKHKDDWFNLDSWPTVELEDKPNKKGKAVTEMFLERALKVVDPTVVVGKKLWEEAMMWLSDNYSGIDEVIEELSKRDTVPENELKAYESLKKLVAGKPKAAEVLKPKIVVLEIPKSIVTEVPKLKPKEIATEVPKFKIPVAAPQVTVKAPITTATAPPVFNPNWGKKK